MGRVRGADVIARSLDPGWTFMRLAVTTTLATLSLLTGAPSVRADPAPPPAPAAVPAAAPATAPHQCFRISDWNGWRAPDAKTLYIRVGIRDIWKIGLAHECSMLRSPSTHIVTRVRGSDQICGPIDLDLSVQDSGGFTQGCFIDSIRPLTPAEAAALDPKNRP
jgi:hypothetical protein